MWFILRGASGHDLITDDGMGIGLSSVIHILIDNDYLANKFVCWCFHYILERYDCDDLSIMQCVIIYVRNSRLISRLIWTNNTQNVSIII